MDTLLLIVLSMVLGWYVGSRIQRKLNKKKYKFQKDAEYYLERNRK